VIRQEVFGAIGEELQMIQAVLMNQAPRSRFSSIWAKSNLRLSGRSDPI